MIPNKPVIGILPTYSFSLENPYLDRASFVTMYIEKIKNCGGIPLGILERDATLYLHLCDAYLIPGGTKIWHEFFPLLEDAMQNHKPVLGICMGCQMLAMYFCLLEDQKKYPKKSLEEVYQIKKLEEPYIKKVARREIHQHPVTKKLESIQEAKHTIQVLKNSLLYQIYAKEILSVVSLHQYEISRVPSTFLVSAKSLDGVIEAMEYQDFMLGVQFHPEILEDTKIFDWLVEEGRKCQRSRK